MTEPILQFFEYNHLPAHLREVSKPFCDLAHKIVDAGSGLPRNPERTVALRKLLEAKDAAVRALIMKDVAPVRPVQQPTSTDLAGPAVL